MIRTIVNDKILTCRSEFSFRSVFICKTSSSHFVNIDHRFRVKGHLVYQNWR